MPKTSRALWLKAPGVASLAAETLEKPTPKDVTVRSRFGAISRGTERLVAAGEVPESEFGRMRAPFQEGDFPFPVKYGYAVVGEVVEGPKERLGETVFCLHPHQDRFTVPEAMIAGVPPGVPAARAVLAANMETAVNIVWDAGAAPGDRISIVGGGLVGLLAGYLAACIPGTETTIVDVDPSREAVAATLGCGFSAPTEAPTGCDVVIHTSGAEAGLATALEAAGFEARIVEASWYGTDTPKVPFGEAFHSRRLSIIASQVGQVPPARRARWDTPRRLALALRLLADERLDCLFSGETRFVDLADDYQTILDAPDTLCHRIVYD